VSLIILAVAALGCAATPARPAPVVTLEHEPPDDCQSLGEVIGSDTGVEARFDWAQDDALQRAARLGATHFRVDRTRTGRTDPGTWTWIGTAYRCPAR
jgi:hypothetical protein